MKPENLRISRSWNEAGLRNLRKGPLGDESWILQNGMAKVTKAYDTATEEYVVVKRVQGSCNVARANKEAARLRAIKHPNVQAFVSYKKRSAKHKAYVVTKHAGSPFGGAMPEGFRDHPRKAIFTAFCGLAALHRNNVIHGDLHEENIVCRNDGTSTIIDLEPTAGTFGEDVGDLFDIFNGALGRLEREKPDSRENISELRSAMASLRSSALCERWCHGLAPTDEELSKEPMFDGLTPEMDVPPAEANRVTPTRILLA